MSEWINGIFTISIAIGAIALLVAFSEVALIWYQQYNEKKRIKR